MSKTKTAGTQYRVVNPLISVRASTDKRSPEYERFLEWREGDLLDDYPAHTDIDGLLAAGHITEVE
jgi:hypothetical protein